MDKNTLLGFLLIGIVLFAFSWLNKPTPEQLEAQRRYQDSIAQIELTKQLDMQKEDSKSIADNSFDNLPDSVREARLKSNFGVFADAMTGTDDVTVLENSLIELHVSNKGGRISYARLKDYTTYDDKPLVLFEGKDASLDFTLVTATNRVLNTGEMYFTPVKTQDPNQLIMRLNTGEGSSLDFIYTIKPDDYMVQFDIKGSGLNGVLAPSTTALDMVWKQKIRQQEQGIKYENRYTALYYKFLADGVEQLSESKSEDKKVSGRLKWIGYKDKFFSSVMISGEGFESATFDSKMVEADGIVKEFKTATAVPFDLRGNEATRFRYFFGPNSYTLLKSFDKGVPADDQLDLEQLVPLGMSVFRWVNQYFVIPMFDFLGKYISSYGLIIFLMTIIVKLILFPLTYKSYMSSAKMRVLRPQVEELNVKYPGQDKAVERQRATMELYSRAGASPMAGCIPMLLQMPVLIALFMFFPSAIELRQQSFLWAHDLSTYDAIFSWSKYIPIITPYFGNHISLFCLLMTATNIVYTKYNMEMTNTGQQQMPGMKAMMYMMPVMMLVFFNQYASGLTYYYFVSTLFTIVQTLVFRYTINEDKLLAKLEANKKKPQKKSGFMKRLEEAQRAQQEQLKKQKQQKKR
ncbi:membrane protein insertase YidC [Parabacteroides sp. GYB001]|uniref:membrane protein insertase YidC n=1 Tax=Parabacteroides leei TaxID=2939491 RepID=UPI00201813E6|nr:membrane protein insertase YidC [Parabacteroides leei]MCL3849690.1 membrane protein insertase YidC [Parabacteroides leei]